MQTAYTGCALITRVDGVKVGLTELDIDLTIDSQLYKSVAGYQGTAFQSTSNLAVNNADLEGVTQLGIIERADVIAGLYSHASVQLFIYDWENAVKVRDITSGRWGETTLTDGRYVAEARSLSQFLQQKIGRQILPECDARLGDTRCGVNLAAFTDSGAVTSVASNQVFTASGFAASQADDYYNYGLLTFTSGLNAGLKQEVKDYNDATGQFTTFLPFPFDVVAADTFDVYAGCDKRKATCIAPFNNVVNFRAFDMLPGNDKISQIGGQ